MSNLPSESLYGSTPDVRQTQLRYTPLEPGQERKLISRLRSLFERLPHQSIVRMTRRGVAWFRNALILLVLGVSMGNANASRYTQFGNRIASRSCLPGALCIFIIACWLVN